MGFASRRFWIAASVVLAFAVGQASAGPLVWFNEWGDGIETRGAAQFALPALVSPDPLSGISTLNYGLGKGISGDVVIYDDARMTVVSDIVRFIGGHIYVFSDPAEPGETPPWADVSPADWRIITDPANWQPNVVRYRELGVEGYNGLRWKPAKGEPGYFEDAQGVGVEYTFVSDAPEPATLVGAAIGVLGLRLLRRRRRAE